jgi:hypothetical protein
MNIKKAVTDYPIQHALADRWIPYGLENRPVRKYTKQPVRALLYR